MPHIEIWPERSISDVAPPKFKNFEETITFWKHLLECYDCRLKLYDLYMSTGDRIYGPSLLLEPFWREVARFIDGIHPSAEHIAQSVLITRASARIAREGRYTEKFRQYLVSWDGSVLYSHFQICAECFEALNQLWDRVEALADFQRKVEETYQRLLLEL